MKAIWHTYYFGRNHRMGYPSDVRVLFVRKHTARIECKRLDGTIKRRFVKLDRLILPAALTKGLVTVKGGC